MSNKFIAFVTNEALAKSIVQVFGPRRSYTLTELSNGIKTDQSAVKNMLEKLIAEDIVEKRIHNKRIYYKLTEAAYQALENILNLRDRTDIRPLKMTENALAERKGRTCYSHLAGELGVAITEKLIEKQLIVLDENIFLLTEKGMAYFKNMGINKESLKKAKVSKACLDWSERKYHLGSPLGKLLTEYLFLQNWIERSGRGRAIASSNLGKEKLKQVF